jgi:site-specific recombinase XerD
MTGESTPVLLLPAPLPNVTVPSLFADAGEHGVGRLLEWLTADIRNPNTRASYARAVQRFSDWSAGHKLRLCDLRPVHAAAYVEHLITAVDEAGKKLSPPTVKQHLAALRMLGNYLVTGQVIPANPFGPVRGPKYVVKKGKTVVLTAAEMRQLLNSFDMTVDAEGRIVDKDPPEFTVAELRDRALIAVLAYSFARVSAVLGMSISDYRRQDDRAWLRLHEKGGKFHEVPCHRMARMYLDAYIAAAGIADDGTAALFRTFDSRRLLTARRLSRREALAMVKRRAFAAGLSDDLCCHSFRATGITVYLQNGGTVEKAQAIACHESPRTTKLYDRREDRIDEEEIERVQF